MAKMPRLTSANSSDIDVPDLMSVLCDFRKERFPFEKYVSLMTFSTWLHVPEHPNIVAQSRITAVALVLLSVNAGSLAVPTSKRQSTIEAICASAFDAVDAATVLVNRAVPSTFEAGFEGERGLYDAAAVAAFIIRCPMEMKPSVNKALFFIDEGGFTGDAFNDESDKDQRYTVAPATVKKGWSMAAIATPFWLSADRLKLTSIGDLPPDNEMSIQKAGELLADPAQMQKYFGTARFIQDQLMQRLRDSVRHKLQFVRFSDTIAINEIPSRPFNSTQLDIIRKYRAPKSI
jgi:hypothetical protein